jgi:ABC-2 type transport system permease protein
MSFSRIKAIMLQELYITKRALEVILDQFFFSVVLVVVFGLISTYLSGENNPLAAKYVILGLLLWEVIRVSQYSLSMGAMWNIWSRNLSNMFVAPLSVAEFMAAYMISALIKTLIVFGIMAGIAIWSFHFNIFTLGFWNLSLYLLNLILFSWSTGFILDGFVFRYGTRVQALVWDLIFLFQPLTAAFFPLQVLPLWTQKIALLFPPTYIFEAARYQLVHSQPPANWIWLPLALNIIYFVICAWLFNYLFAKSKESGQFARNEQ